jgi:metal-responsive CopG/Arc/MetJ family transcriptional regulator
MEVIVMKIIVAVSLNKERLKNLDDYRKSQEYSSFRDNGSEKLIKPSRAEALKEILLWYLEDKEPRESGSEWARGWNGDADRS